MNIFKQRHKSEFVRVGTGEKEECFMVCSCGARIKIESFKHSWSIIETRVKWEKHLKESAR